MGLSHEDVKRLLELLDASKFDELHLESDGTKLTLRRNGAGNKSTTIQLVTTEQANADAPTQIATAKVQPSSNSGGGLVNVRASMLGQFYSAPKPGAAPFVVVGSKVRADTAIAIIEVMKLMNSICAGVDGEVVEIFVRDGELVEFEQVLMSVRPA